MKGDIIISIIDKDTNEEKIIGVATEEMVKGINDLLSEHSLILSERPNTSSTFDVFTKEEKANEIYNNK